MMRGFYSGLIGGFLGGTVVVVTIVIGAIAGLKIWYFPEFLDFDFVINYLIYQVGYEGIFGGIFGIFYSIFYNRIPGKGVKKGLIFGCMVAFLSNIWMSSNFYLSWLFTSVDSHYATAFAFVWGCIIWVVYGLMLGPLYERLKL